MANQEAVFAEGGPAPGGPYTPAVRAGNLLFISGQIGRDPDTGKPYDDFERQVEGTIEALRVLVEAGGGTLADIVKTTVFLDDIQNFARLNAVYARYFNGPVLPARSTFQVAALPVGAAVEIEAIALLGG